MAVRKDASGARSVESEVEVTGSPEEVWEAIATGPGISAWFVPSASEERVGGTATNDFGPGMQSVATITEWDPPRMFAAETEEQPGCIATEWHVEARDGGTCVVRVVHRWFSDSDEWDSQFEGHTEGWQSFFRILRTYLEHFRGQPSSGFALSFFRTSTTPDAMWSAVMDSLNTPAAGETVNTPSGPAVVERVGSDPKSELLLRLNGTAAGTVHLFPMAIGEQTLFSARGYLYGTGAGEAVGPTEEQWAAWADQVLPGEAPEPAEA